MKVSNLSILRADDIKQLLEFINSGYNVNRKREALKAYECSEGAQMGYVKAKLKELYPKSHEFFRRGNLSITKKITLKKTKAYKQPPIRTLKTEKQSKAYNEILELNNLSRGFSEMDKVFNLHKYVAVWISYVNPKEKALKGKYVLRALHPFDYDVFRDEVTGEPLIFSLPYVESEDTKKYVLYDAQNIVTVILNTKTNKIESIKKDKNKLGRLPFTFLSTDLASTYPIASPLADQSIDWNVELSDLKTASATQGHGQLVIKYPSGNKPKEFRMGMHSAIMIPQSSKPDALPTDANYIGASPDLNGQLDVIKFDLVALLEEHGITPKSGLLGGVNDITSGFDRLLKEADVQDIVEENQTLYAKGPEQDIYLTISAYERLLNNKIFTDKEIAIVFQKPKVLISDKETLDNIKQREELGLILPWQKHQIINPNLSDDQAKKLEEEIQLERNKQIKEMNKILGEQPEPPIEK